LYVFFALYIDLQGHPDDPDNPDRMAISCGFPGRADPDNCRGTRRKRNERAVPDISTFGTN
jgi:hypothetical protein